MSNRFLKHVPSGQVFVYQDVFAKRDDFVEVSDANGSPMVVETEDEDVPVAKPRGRAKKPGIVVPEDNSDLDDFDAALSADASRGA